MKSGRQCRVTVAVWLAVLIAAPLAYATDFTSTNFISRDPVFGDYGDFKSGASFQQYDVGGQPVIGESTSTNFILRSGFMYFNEYTPRTENWRWYTDEASLTPTSALAAENTAPTGVANFDILKLRWTFRELAGISSQSIKFKLQYDTTDAFTTPLDVVASASCSGASFWCYANGAGNDNDVIDAGVLSDSDTCTGGSGAGCGTHNETGTASSSYTHLFNASAEFEFTLQASGPTPDTVYYFRAVPITGGDAIEPFTGQTYPSLTVEGAKMMFVVEGVASSSATEGITTDITTTDTTIDFGTLTPGTEYEGAQKLNMTTNAQSGYTVYMFGGQLTNGSGEQIASVSGTNASPSAWTIQGGQNSAFGYHSGDDLLSGASTRFAADDTYARMELTSEEIVYSQYPVDDEETDIVYKIEATGLQGAGTYNASLQYIAVPVF